MSFDELKRTLDAATSRELGRGANDSEIGHAEARLEVSIAGEYRTFLRQYGWGGVGSVELYGLGHGVPAHLDLVAITESERTEMAPRLPRYLLPVMNDGGGNLYCIDTREEQPCVVLWDHEAEDDQRPTIEGATFSEWLIALLEQQK